MGNSVGFNGATSLAQQTKRWIEANVTGKKAILDQKMTNVRISNDPVSASGYPFGKTVTYKTDGATNLARAHSLDRFKDTGFNLVDNSAGFLETAGKTLEGKICG